MPTNKTLLLSATPSIHSCVWDKHAQNKTLILPETNKWSKPAHNKIYNIEVIDTELPLHTPSHSLHIHNSVANTQNAWVADTRHPYFPMMRQAMCEGYGITLRILGSGASIPGVHVFNKYLPQAAILMTDLEDPAINAHGENESVIIEDLHNAIFIEALFFAMV